MKLKNIPNFLFIALAPTGNGISGSDRIFIELAREWSKKTSVQILTTSEGINMASTQLLTGKFLTMFQLGNRLPKSFVLKYIYKIFLGIKSGITFKINKVSDFFVYSSSDFWMDVIPALLIKLRFNKVKWIATWYQTAPNPLKGYSYSKSMEKRNNKYFVSALLYWFSQLPIKLLVKKFADYVVVNNEDEKRNFPEMEKQGKVFVLIGAVRLDNIKKYLAGKKLNTVKKYDAVFQGRFHPQKGVVELINIWKRVTKKIPNACLAMVGDGPLMAKVKVEIKKNKLENNVKLFGYLFDGAEKYKIFSESKLIVHPAFYDSGGMAAAEAMAFGLPAVGFNLKAYESYYPQGMLKVEYGNLDEFSEKIIELITNESKRKSLGKIAQLMIESNWSWQQRVKQLEEFINENKKN